jgi:large conductance mechanosensitive channel
MSGFKKFILRGNVLDLAVAVVIGATFTAVVQALVKDIITPIIGVFGKIPDFSSLFFTVNGSRFLIGDFINALLGFLVIAVIIYYFVVVPANAVLDRMKETPPATRECPMCLSKIPAAALRCAFCTSMLTPEGIAETAAKPAGVSVTTPS